MPHRSTRRTALVVRHALAAVVLLATACAPRPVPAQSSAPAPAPRPAQAVAPMDLSGQKVLVLPAQAATGIAQSRDEVTRELLFALGERDTRTQWIDPERLRAALRRTPGYADDPDALPAESFRHHNERYMQGAMGSLVRRYSALMDVRLVLIPRGAQWLAVGSDGGGRVRLSAVVVDARSGNVVWWGDADGETRPSADGAALATAAAALAARMVISR